MTRPFRSLLALSLFCTFAIVGCAKPKEPMDMSKASPPPRPAELDKLNPMVGNWDWEMTMNMEGMDKPMTMCGTSHASWDLGNTYVVEKMEGDMGAMGKFYGMNMMTWDPEDKVFRSWFFENMGGVEHGKMKYDEATRTWTGTSKGENAMTGEETYSESTAKIADNNTIEWSGTQWTGKMKTKKVMDMKGVSKRQKM